MGDPIGLEGVAGILSSQPFGVLLFAVVVLASSGATTFLILAWLARFDGESRWWSVFLGFTACVWLAWVGLYVWAALGTPHRFLILPIYTRPLLVVTLACFNGYTVRVHLAAARRKRRELAIAAAAATRITEALSSPLQPEPVEMPTESW